MKKFIILASTLAAINLAWADSTHDTVNNYNGDTNITNAGGVGYGGTAYGGSSVATGGNASSSVNNSNRNNNVNSNKQQQGQAQGQQQSLNNSNQASNSGNNNTTSFNYRAAASTAYAPSIAPTSICMGSSSVGGGGITFSFSAGSSWTDKNCMLLEQVRAVAVGLGDKDTAAQMMCSVEAYANARKLMGKPCLE